MLNAIQILELARSKCIRESNIPGDRADKASVVLSSAIYYLNHGKRLPPMWISTVELFIPDESRTNRS